MATNPSAAEVKTSVTVLPSCISLRNLLFRLLDASKVTMYSPEGASADTTWEGTRVTKSEAPRTPARPKPAARMENGRGVVFFMVPTSSVLADTTNLNEKVMNVPSGWHLILKNLIRKRSLHRQCGGGGFGLCLARFHQHGQAALPGFFQHHTRFLDRANF